MKNLVARRIIILMTIAILSTSIIIVLLGVYLSEDAISYIRAQAYTPDITVLTEVTKSYYNGEINQEVYEKIMVASEKEKTNQYIIYDANGNKVYTTIRFPEAVEAYIITTLNEVIEGKTVFQRFHSHSLGKAEVALTGTPLMIDGQYIGAVFLAADMVDLTDVKYDFFKSLIVATAIVFAFVILMSNYALRRIIKPIRNVVSVALAMVEGDFSIEADEDLKGEIGFIGKTLNMLSRELYINVSQLYIEKNRLNHILNSLEEGMIAVDENLMMTHMNDVMRSMSGHKGLLTGPMPLGDLTFANQIESKVREVLRDHQSSNVKMNEGELIYRVLIEPIENEQGTVVGAVVLFRDVTDLENLESTRKNYVANVSHELRSPLTSIQGLIEPLMDDIVTDPLDVKRYYNIIYQESRRLSRLVNDIMELSRLQTSDAKIEKSKANLFQVLDLVYERYRRIDPTIELIYKPVDLPEVITNGDRVEQVLVILLDNAFKFTSEGGTIEILSEVDENEVVLGVRDTGAGIAKEMMPYIFDRFFKADQARTKKSTGLGLSIAKEIMDIMGENITCSSVLGEGSTFKITIKR